MREIGGLRVDLGLRQVVVDERAVHLTVSQFKLLALLTEDPGRIVTRREILHRLWDSSHHADNISATSTSRTYATRSSETRATRSGS